MALRFCLFLASGNTIKFNSSHGQRLLNYSFLQVGHFVFSFFVKDEVWVRGGFKGKRADMFM